MSRLLAAQVQTRKFSCVAAWSRATVSDVCSCPCPAGPRPATILCKARLPTRHAVSQHVVFVPDVRAHISSEACDYQREYTHRLHDYYRRQHSLRQQVTTTAGALLRELLVLLLVSLPSAESPSTEAPEG